MQQNGANTKKEMTAKCMAIMVRKRIYKLFAYIRIHRIRILCRLQCLTCTALGVRTYALKKMHERKRISSIENAIAKLLLLLQLLLTIEILHICVHIKVKHIDTSHTLTQCTSIDVWRVL